ncbi:hypothetical protein BV25DRAFT_1914577 [Artomyces pyxidatus]|uniref:Uncharacterized protein n=1 Tax=Artomyces pyxidatus TaxID=48021 RepID=A0ACB8T8P5_9AGAM|nr:hypothetical protein BV25DRAFT_1914577 [Artomyces pyxidatus]
MTSAASDAAALASAVKVIHVCNGIFLWEYFTTMRFEWEVFTGQRPWRWSFAIYMISRLLALGSVILTFIGFNLQTEFDCNAWFRCVLVFSWFAIAFASFLLVLRAIAIWHRNVYVTIFVMGLWFMNFGSATYSVTKGHTEWLPSFNTCLISGTADFRWGIMINFIEDLSLIAVMFLGVLDKKNATDLWRLLYVQGLAWMACTALSEIPAVVLSFLNINDGWNLMFQVPHMVIMVIISTRVYRNLFQYIIGEHDSTPYLFRHRRDARMSAMNASSDGVQVNVHRTVEVDVELNSLDRRDDSDMKGSMKGTVPVSIRTKTRAQEEMERVEQKMKEQSLLGI